MMHPRGLQIYLCWPSVTLTFDLQTDP